MGQVNVKARRLLGLGNSSSGSSSMGYFSSVPDDVVFLILSKLSPRDVCRLSAVSSPFRSACGSDALWEKFVPSEFPAGKRIQSSYYSGYSSKKDLYFGLCSACYHLIDNTTKLLEFDKSSGKIACTIEGGTLNVECDTVMYWRNDYLKPKSLRVDELLTKRMTVELRKAFHIQTKVETRRLSPNTAYSVHLVYSFVDSVFMPWMCMSAPLLVELTAAIETGESISTQQRVTFDGGLVLQRDKEWAETEVGEFYNDRGTRELEITLMNTNESQTSYERIRWRWDREGQIQDKMHLIHHHSEANLTPLYFPLS